MLSTRRRRTSTDNTEYSEVCCDDWDPGSTVTDAPNTDHLDWYSNESQEEFDNLLDRISRWRYVAATPATQSTTIEATTAASTTSEGATATTTVG